MWNRKIRRRAEDDDFDFMDLIGSSSHGSHIVIVEDRSPEPIGLVDSRGFPIYRVFMNQPEMGFLSEEVADYDPNCYYHGSGPDLAPIGEDE